MGAQRWITCEHIVDPLVALKTVREQVGTLVALETGWEDSDIHEHTAPRPCALVLGNEALGLDEAALALCDLRVQLPVLGRKNSLNVGVAFGACAYEILRQWSTMKEET